MTFSVVQSVIKLITLCNYDSSYRVGVCRPCKTLYITLDDNFDHCQPCSELVAYITDPFKLGIIYEKCPINGTGVTPNNETVYNDTRLVSDQVT